MLTRLAAVLCDENEDEDLTSPNSSTFEIDHANDHKGVDLESAFHRIRRSLHLSKNSCNGQIPCPTPSPKEETDVTNAHPFATNRRVRHVSENHSHVILDLYRSMKRNQKLMPDASTTTVKPQEFKRSLSERFPPNHIFPASSVHFTPVSHRAQLKNDLLWTGTICNPGSSNTQKDLPNASVVEFCHMLDCVDVQSLQVTSDQVSHENSSSNP